MGLRFSAVLTPPALAPDRFRRRPTLPVAGGILVSAQVGPLATVRRLFYQAAVSSSFESLDALPRTTFHFAGLSGFRLREALDRSTEMKRMPCLTKGRHALRGSRRSEADA